jgi:hypothetical protein
MAGLDTLALEAPPIPPADVVPLPLPVAVFKVLLLLTFGLHILAVDLGLGGSILVLGLALKGRTSGAHAAIAKALAWALAPAVTFAITLGVAPLLFVQVLYGRFLYASSILMAAPWLSFIAALIAGYALLYSHTGKLKEGRFSVPLGVTSAIFLLWVGFLWTNNATLMLGVDRWASVAAQAPHGGALNLGDATVVPRFAHMAVAMTAVAALFLAASTLFFDEKHPPFDLALARKVGLRTFGYLTLVQLALGPVVIGLQRPSIRSALISGSSRATGALSVAIPTALIAAITALRGANPKTGRNGVLVPFVLVHVTIAAMIVLRDAVRDLSLREVGFNVADTPVSVDVFAAAAFAVAASALVLSIRAMFIWLAQGRAASMGGDPPYPPAPPATTAKPARTMKAEVTDGE